MASIIGEKSKNATGQPKKWHNATDLASINDSVAVKTAELNAATKVLNEATTAITAGGNTASGCNKSPICNRRHISSWRDIRDKNAPLVAKLKAELSELLTLQSQLAATQTQSAAATEKTAAAKKAVTEADTASTVATTTKWGLYGLIGVGVIALMIGGYVMYKKFKKK